MDEAPLAKVSRLFRVVGLCAIALAALPPILREASLITGVGTGSRPSPAVFSLWLGLMVVYGLAFWWTVGRIGRDALGPPVWSALGAQAVMWVAMFWLTGLGYHMARTQLVLGAAQLGLTMPVRPGIYVVIALGALQTVVGARHYPAERMFFSYVTLLVPYGFAAMVATNLVARDVQARAALIRKNVELHEAQVAVAEKQRLDERLRISRELHDVVGHHLTALSLKLEVAGHVATGPVRNQVRECQDLTRLLLQDVRDVVGSLRRDGDSPPPGAGDLRKTLHALTAQIVRPQVHLTVGDGLGAIDRRTGHILVRCVQEIITNGVRHSQAENLWIRLTRAGEVLRVDARDDGVGAPQVRPGHGLHGMAERVELAGGTLEIASSPADGFRLALSFPLVGEVS